MTDLLKDQARVQRLVEADVPFNAIGNYIGHRADLATQIYAKVAVHKLQPLAVGAARRLASTRFAPNAPTSRSRVNPAAPALLSNSGPVCETKAHRPGNP